MKNEVITWLLDRDPAIRWQVHCDLLHSPARVVARERSRVTKEGWGARLLACQRPDGHWGAGAYFPKWTCTTYALQLLRDLGMPPPSPRCCAPAGEGDHGAPPREVHQRPRLPRRAEHEAPLAPTPSIPGSSSSSPLRRWRRALRSLRLRPPNRSGPASTGRSSTSAP